MANDKLVNLRNQLAEAKELASRDLSGWDPRTVVGMQTQKRTAEDSLEPITNQYKRALRDAAVLIILTGDPSKAERVAEAAKAEGVVTIRADALYRKFAGALETTMDSRRLFTTAQAVRLVEEITDFARNNEIWELPLPKVDVSDFNAGAPTPEDTVAIVRKAIRATCEDDLNAIILERDALNLAVEGGATGNVLPVVIYALTNEELPGIRGKVFAGRPSISVSVEQPVEEGGDVVEAVMAVIREEFAAIAQ